MQTFFSDVPSKDWSISRYTINFPYCQVENYRYNEWIKSNLVTKVKSSFTTQKCRYIGQSLYSWPETVSLAHTAQVFLPRGCDVNISIHRRFLVLPSFWYFSWIPAKKKIARFSEVDFFWLEKKSLFFPQWGNNCAISFVQKGGIFAKKLSFTRSTLHTSINYRCLPFFKKKKILSRKFWSCLFDVKRKWRRRTCQLSSSFLPHSYHSALLFLSSLKKV